MSINQRVMTTLMKLLCSSFISQAPKRFLCLFVFLLSSIFYSTQIAAQSNEGTEFWFGFMEHLDKNQNTKVAMISSKTTTSGTISIPLRAWSQTFNVTANEVTLVTLPIYTEVIGSEFIENVGIQLTSQSPVSVYIHQYENFRSEATVVLPTASIGREYYAMSYLGYTQGSNVSPSEFLVVATEDETNVTINVSDETAEGKSPGTSFEVLLNKGEVYQVQAAKGTGDLTGSYITGNKKFALFSGNSWTQVPSTCPFRDNLLEQMYSIETWGKQFVTVPNANVTYDVFRILASEDNTEIEVVGSSNTVQNYMLNAGEFQEYQKSEATYISSEKPILVSQYNTGSSCNGHEFGDPAMVLLNSVEQTRDTVTLFNSSLENISENYINIITATDDVPNITFDGQPIPNTATTGTVGLNDEFTYIQLEVSAGAHTIISGGCGIIATAYGYGQAESYAYSGGASFSEINANPIPEGGCLNDTIFFDTGLPTSKYDFFWNFGGGDTSTEKEFERIYNELGTFPVQLIVHDKCLDTRDTSNREMKITLRQAVDVIADIKVCEGESIELGATDLADARYEWIGPNEYFEELQFPIINNTNPSMTGQYEVIGIVSGCATFPAILNVEIVPTPEPLLDIDPVFCIKTEEIELNPGEFDTYLWQDGSIQSTFPLEREGTYSVEVTNDFGCVGSTSQTFTEQCPTRIVLPAAFSPNEDGINDTFGIEGDDIISTQLTIYNRWGEQLFLSTDPNDRWDGYKDFRILPQGVYVWQLVFEGFAEDGTTYSEVRTGTVTLLR